MPVSKKRRKKRSYKPSGPPISKAELAAKQRKLTKRQILIYVFSALIILSFALSFVVGYGDSGSVTQDGSQVDTGNSGILLTPASENATTEENSGNNNSASGTDTQEEPATEN